MARVAVFEKNAVLLIPCLRKVDFRKAPGAHIVGVIPAKSFGCWCCRKSAAGVVPCDAFVVNFAVKFLKLLVHQALLMLLVFLMLHCSVSSSDGDLCVCRHSRSKGAPAVFKGVFVGLIKFLQLQKFFLVGWVLWGL